MAAKKKQLTRSQNKILAGVCAGIAQYTDSDPTLIRILAVIIALLTGVIPAIIAYAILAVITPEHA